MLLDKVAAGQTVLPGLTFVRVSIIPLMIHTHFYLNTNVIRRTSG